MQALLSDIAEVCDDWPVWSLGSHDASANTAVITRSDEDMISVTITVSASYPRGEIKLRDTFNRAFTGNGMRVGDALDSAIESWDDSEDFARGQSSMFFEAARAGSDAVSGAPFEADVVESVLERNKALVAKHAADASVRSFANVRYEPSLRKFVARVACPLSSMDTMRAHALSLEREQAIIVELQFSWQYLEAASMPAVTDIFMAPVAVAAGPSDNAERRLGALAWYLKNRVETIIMRNWKIVERRRMNISAEDDAACEDLRPFLPTVPEENFMEGNEMNLFSGLLKFLSWRIRNCTGVCLICDDPLPFEGLKLATCDKDLCHHSADSYGLGCDVLYELEKRPEVSELLIYLTFSAAQSGVSGRDVLTPMCPVMINASAFAGYHGPTHFYTGPFGTGGKNFRLLVDTVQNIPPVPTMLSMANGSEKTLRDELNRKSPLLFPLLRWILSSNRAHLEPIPERSHMSGLGKHQFHLVSSNPSKEGRFKARKEQAKIDGAKTSNDGSFYVWHGSSPGNWHCIMRSGLKNYSNTKFMSAGAAHGPGIYTAHTMSTSIHYMGSTNGAWKGAHYFKSTNGLLLISLCEVVDEVRGKSRHTGRETLHDKTQEITTVQDEDLIDTRFLFVFPDRCDCNTSIRAKDVSVPRELLH